MERKKFGVIGSVVTILGSLVSGCSYQEATVLSEFGTIPERHQVLQASEGAYFGNESIRMGATYGLKFKTDNGNVCFRSINGGAGGAGHLEALSKAIKGEEDPGVKKGTRIGIQNGHSYTFDEKTVVGSMKARYLKVLPPTSQ